MGPDSCKRSGELTRMPEAPLTLPVLIRTIRNARTQAEERELVQRESAKIRGAFRGDEPDTRASNLAKLLYIHILGYPAHFGQMECLKLIASHRFHEKRIGYLGAALLLDEKQDTHLLLTNSIKNDLLHSSAWVQGLALSTLGSLGSVAMLRDLAGEVIQLARAGQPSVRRKAVVCAVHVIRKVPDLIDLFTQIGEQLLTERSHGILHGAVMLIAEMCQQSLQALEHFCKFVPQLVMTLRNLVVAGYSPDNSISGISDPFLQVQILRLLRILGQDNRDASDAMNDSLAQVDTIGGTNTETTRNVGNAILYETVLPIMGVRSTSGLRVLAINILGRFLLNKDRNIRYVALTSLQKLLQVENSAVQRHRGTVLECLADPDPTVKRRALQLSLALVNSSNVRTTIKELLLFLETCALDLKADCASGIFLAAEKFAPSKRWHIDTILQVLTMAGSYVRDDAVPNLIHLIGGAKELHGYAVQQLYKALTQDISQQPLVQVATWCIGEYGNLLVDSSCEEVEAIQVDPEEMLSLLERVLQSHFSLPSTRGYALTALMKLGTRLRGNDINGIRRLVSIYCSCHDVELQQRAVEYNALFRKYDHLRASVLEKMPVVDKTGYSEEGSEQEQSEREDVAPRILEVAPASSNPKQQESSQVSDLLDLLGSPADSSAAQPSTVTPVAESFLDLLGALKPPAAGSSRMAVYERDGLLVEFLMDRPPLEPTLLLITATVSNRTPNDIAGFSLQVAVPKSFQVELLAPSSSTVLGQGGPPVTQLIRVLNPKKLPLRMRLRLAYTLPSGALVQQIEEISSFPEAAWK
ncbi:LOW QUALITY PROTEIN: AP-1 complex subunit gamma-like 2 [Rhineura floridana]|uniref:LOW QUALITY PROTEIN: AP-1 complex subunit gamma-like 2 n=1 Tax=Rhineura floridana TaxID=261503 RepID=UPI002AC84FEA|nr:LOW QUALITY PROTEIN: AP-1 complex subunit gamma-like 2 [Rhineura floridana]